MEVLLQQILNGLVLGSMYALVALGYTMVYGIIGLINFAHGDVLMVGALTSWTLIGWMMNSWAGMPGWLILLVATLIAMVVCAVLNFSIEKLAYRPLRNSNRLAPLITAIGMSLLLQTFAMIIWAPNPKSYPSMLSREPIEFGGAVISVTQITILAVTAITLAFLMWLVNRTNLGRAMRATAENPRVAALMGIKPDMVISATFIIGAMLAAIAQHGLVGDTRTPVDVTYLADTVILLRYFETRGRLRRAISVVKKRTGAHEDTIREYSIGADGVRIGEALVSFQGMARGVRSLFGDAPELIEERH